MSIFDWFKPKLNPAIMPIEVAKPQVGGARAVSYTSVASSLTPASLARIITSANEGDTDAMLTLAEEMEERDMHYHGVLTQRKSAVSGLDPIVEAASDDERDQQVADFVRGIVSENCFTDLLSDLLDAISKSYSVCEIVWQSKENKWLPKKYIWRDPRHFVFDKDTFSILRLRDKSNENGLPLDYYKYIVHQPKIKTGLPIRGGLARLACAGYMIKSYSIKDWLAFAEVCGMPIRVGKFPAGSNTETQTALLNAVASIGIDAACIIPEGMNIEFITGNAISAGSSIYKDLISYIDSQISKGVLGQTMTTDSGSSLSQAQVHDGVRMTIVRDDARKLAATIQRDLINVIVELNFGKDVKAPRLVFHIPQPEDLVALSSALAPMIDRGLRVSESVMRDKFGLPDPGDDAVLKSQAAAPMPNLLNRSTQAAQIASTAPRVRKDEIDKLIEESTKEWRDILGPMLDPIFVLVEKAATAEEVLDGLATMGLDGDQLVRSISLAMIKARGLAELSEAL